MIARMFLLYTHVLYLIIFVVNARERATKRIMNTIDVDKRRHASRRLSRSSAVPGLIRSMCAQI